MAEATPAVDGYRGPQVCSVVGITYRQLDYWARTDLLRPSISEAKGSGTQRRYSYRDLLELKVIKRLLDAGISLRSARRALEVLRQSGEEVTTANLVLNGSQSVLATSGEQIIDLLKGGQGVLNIVPLSGVVSELEAAIHQLGVLPGPGSAAGAGPEEAGDAKDAGSKDAGSKDAGSKDAGSKDGGGATEVPPAVRRVRPRAAGG